MKFSTYTSYGSYKGWGIEKDGPSRRVQLGKLSICIGLFDLEPMLEGILNREKRLCEEREDVNATVVKVRKELEDMTREERQAAALEEAERLQKAEETSESIIKELNLDVERRDKQIEDLKRQLEKAKDDTEGADITIEELEEKIEEQLEEIDKYDEDQYQLKVELGDVKKAFKELEEYVNDIEQEREDLDEENIDMLLECLELEDELDSIPPIPPPCPVIEKYNIKTKYSLN